MNDEDMPGGADGGTEAERAMKARLRKFRGRPGRDPVLYEMSEFVK